MVAYYSKKFVVVADYRKEAEVLGTKVSERSERVGRVDLKN